MSWNTNCRKVRMALALWSGNDLDEAGQTQVRRHVAVCPKCREKWSRLQAGQLALEQMRVATQPAGLSASIWPAVERQITVLEEPVAASWRGWLPAGALAAACLTVVMVTSNGPQPSTEQASRAGRPPVVFQRVRSPIIRADGSPAERHDESDDMGLPDLPRVRTLLDGSDARGL